MPMSRLLAGRRVMSRPPTVICPLSASSSPASSRRVVVFPQPDGPSRATSSPGRSVRSSPSRAVTGPYRRVSPSIWTSTAARGAAPFGLVTGELTEHSSSPAAPAADEGQDQQQDEGEQQRCRRGGEEHSGVRRLPADVEQGDLQVD